jgi:hypothetical protein
MRSTSPLHTGWSLGMLNNWYLMELLPELMTKTFIALGLDKGMVH